jgi:hypothetical protein
MNSKQYDQDSVDVKITSFKGIRLTHLKDIDTFEETLDLQRQHFYLGSMRAKDTQGNVRQGNWLFIFNKVIPSFIPSENITR